MLVLAASLCVGQDVQLDVKERTLENGLRILVVERHHTPRISCRLFYHTGAVNDPQGMTGVTHLFEHMMFKGTQVIGTTNYRTEARLMAGIDAVMEEIAAEKRRGGPEAETRIEVLKAQYDRLLARQRKVIRSNELVDIYKRNGGTGFNAFTSHNWTAYVVNLPSNKLELFMWLDSDRMMNAVLREFYAERDVVCDERRLGVDANPSGHYNEELRAVHFTAHPYRRPVVGWEHEVSAITRAQAEAYFRTYYAPNNATLALVGDVKPDTAFRMAERYLGRVPPSPEPIPILPLEEPEQHGERRIVVESTARPEVSINFHAPKFGEEDYYPLRIAPEVLNGRSGRLYRKIVLDLDIGVDAWAGYWGGKYAGSFGFDGILKGEHTHQEMEDALLAEIERLKDEPPTDHEIEKARNSVEADFIRGLRSNDGLAQELGNYAVLGDWQYIFTVPEKLKAVTGEDVARVAREYFVLENRTVGWLKEKPKEAEPASERAGGEAP